VATLHLSKKDNVIPHKNRLKKLIKKKKHLIIKLYTNLQLQFFAKKKDIAECMQKCIHIHIIFFACKLLFAAQNL